MSTSLCDRLKVIVLITAVCLPGSDLLAAARWTCRQLPASMSDRNIQFLPPFWRAAIMRSLSALGSRYTFKNTVHFTVVLTTRLTKVGPTVSLNEREMRDVFPDISVRFPVTFDIFTVICTIIYCFTLNSDFVHGMEETRKLSVWSVCVFLSLSLWVIVFIYVYVFSSLMERKIINFSTKVKIL